MDKTNTCVAVNPELWQDFKTLAFLKKKKIGQLLEELIKKEVDDNGRIIQEVKKI